MEKLRKLVRQVIANYHLFQLNRDQWRDPRELGKIQFTRLKAIIKHAFDYVPYYHRIFSSMGVRPDDIKSFEDLRELPLVSKQDIQKEYQNFVAKGIDVSKLPSRNTSGSTGMPLKLISDPYPSPGSSRYPFFACGVKLRDKFVTIWGRAMSASWGAKYTRLWGDISETIIPLLPEEKLIRILRQIKPDVLLTFPSVLLSLSNCNFSEINPRLIFTQGEMVTPYCRDVVKKKFGIDLFETYGSVEFGNMAFECTEHFALHILTDNVYIELLDENGEPVSPGERGEIVVTGLHNYVMPLIRYRIGDLGILTDEKCPCGRSWPLLKSIEGRSNDFVALPSGRKISWLHLQRCIFYDSEFQKNLFCMSQYQLVQERRDRIVFKVVKGSNFDANLLLRIKNNIEEFFAKQGEKLDVTMQIVKEIPVERTGKKRMFISKVI
ncbi:MAG: phenylacetate--CoA ligase family protein [Candidatus Bathyarchaeales archaeon]